MSYLVLSILSYYCFTDLLEATDCLREENRREELCKLSCNSFPSGNMLLMPLLIMNRDDYICSFPPYVKGQMPLLKGLKRNFALLFHL